MNLPPLHIVITGTTRVRANQKYESKLLKSHTVKNGRLAVIHRTCSAGTRMGQKPNMRQNLENTALVEIWNIDIYSMDKTERERNVVKN